MTNNDAVMEGASHVLYVAADHEDSSAYCRGSRVCLDLVKRLPDGAVLVQDCDVLQKTQPLPRWLNGTPMLVDTATMRRLKGSRAIAKLSDLTPRTAPVAEPATPLPATVAAASTDSRGDIEELALFDDVTMESNLLPAVGHEDVQNVPIGDGKVTEQELQEFMSRRQT